MSKERVTSITNSQGQEITVRVRYVEDRVQNFPVSERVIQRENIPRFGQAASYPDSVIYFNPNPKAIIMETPGLADQVDDGLTNPFSRFSYQHDITNLRMFRDKERDIEFSNSEDESKRELMQRRVEEERANQKNTKPDNAVSRFMRQGGESGGYVPPSRRGGSSAGFTSEERFDDSMYENNEDHLVIRVGNIDTTFDEYELRDEFSRFGRCKMRWPSYVKQGQKIHRDFAYVTFENSWDAEEAMAQLEGMRANGLVLSLEWAKNDKRGKSKQRRTGYGQKLAQSSHQQFSTVSNLTR
jgi:hypothetical protein